MSLLGSIAEARCASMISRFQRAGLLLVAAFFLAIPMSSATVSWVNPGSGSWSVGANWSGGQVPTAADDVVLGLVGASPHITYTVTLSSSVTVNSITIGVPSITDTASFQTLALNGWTLTINNASLVDGRGTLNIPSGGLTGAGSLSVTGMFIWGGGSMSGTGTTTINATGTLSLAGGSYPTLDGRTLINNGTIAYQLAGSYFSIYNGGVLTNNNAFNATTDAQIYTSNGGTFNNAGTFTKSTATGVTTIYTVFNNSGTLNVSSGSLAFVANTSHSGTVNVGASAILRFGGGTHTLGAGTSLSGAGTIEITNGQVNVETPLTIGTSVFKVAGGTLGGTANRTFTNQLAFHSGTITGTGSTTIDSAGTLDIPNLGYTYINGHTLTNLGTMTYASSSYYLTLTNGGTLNNNGAFNIEGSSYIYASGTGTNRIVNAGTMTKSVSAAVTTLYPVFDNSGTVNVQVGTLAPAGGGTHTGALNVSGGATLLFNAGTHTFLTGSTLAGAGTADVNSGTVNADNPLTISIALFRITGGTFGGAANRIISNTLEWTSGTIRGSVGTSTEISPGGTLSIPGPGYTTLDGHLLAVYGNTTYGPPSSYLNLANGAQLTNYGAFTITTDARIYNSGATALFVNEASGSITKSGGTGTTLLESLVNNNGTMTAASGILSLTGGGTSAGSFVASTGTLRFGGGSHALTAASSVSGAGIVELVSGGVSILGSWSPSTTVIAGATADFGAAASSANLTVSSGIMQGSATFTVSGAFTFTGGTMKGTGTTTVASSGSASIPNTGGYAYIDGRTLDLQANTTFGTGPYYLSIYNGGVLANSGVFDAQGDARIYSNGVGAPRIDNTGTFQKTGGTGIADIDVVMNNNGTVVVSSGTFSFNGGGTSAGTFTANTPGTVRFGNGTHSLTGTSVVNGTGTIRFSGGTNTVAGTYGLSGSGLTLVDGGTNTIDVAASSPGLTVTSGILQGTGTYTVSGPFTMTGGVLKGSGTTTVLATGSASFPNNAGYSYVEGRTLQIQANTTYGAGPYYLSIYSGGVLANSGVFTLQGDARIYSNGFLSPRIDNSGTLQKSGGTGEAEINPVFNNTGAVAVSSGTLSFTAGGTSSGSFTSTAPGTLRFNGGTHALTAPSTIGGTGNVRFSNATITIAGTYALSGSGVTVVDGATVSFDTASSSPGLTISGGIMQGAATFTVSGPFTLMGGSLKGPGTTTILPSASASFPNSSNYAYLDGRTLQLQTSTTYGPGPYYTSLYNGAVIQNSAVFDMLGDARIYTNGVGSPRIENSGTFQKSGGTGQSDIDVAMNNTGAVSVTTGTLSFNGGGTSSGSFNVSAPGTLRFNGGAHSLTGTSSVGGTGSVRFTNGTTTIAGVYAPSGSALTTVEGGTHTFSSAASSPGLTVSGGVMQGAGTFTVSGPFLFSGGQLQGAGTTRVLASGSATISNTTNYTYLDGRTLVLDASTSYGGGPYYFSIYNGGVLENNATFTVVGNGIIYTNGGGSRIDNNGSFVKSGGTADSAVYPIFNNNGTVGVSAAILSFHGSGSGSGSFNATAPGTLRFGSGTFSLTGPITSDGTVEITFATVNASGSFANSGLTTISSGTLSLAMPSATMTDFTLSGGTLSGSALVDLSGTMNWTSGTIGGTTIVAVGASPAAVNLTGGGTKYLFGGTLRNAGIATWSGTGWIYGNQGGAIENLAGGSFTASGPQTFYYSCCTGTAPRFDNQPGATFVRSGSGATTQFYGATFTNGGTVSVASGTLDFSSTPFTQTAGIFQIDSGATASSNTSFNLQGGSFMGSGTFTGNVLNSGGSVKAGTSPGILTIVGSYTQGASASLDVELGGLTAGTEFDQLNVAGTASLGGTLNVTLLSPYAPSDGDAYRILTFGTLAPSPNNAFATTNGTDLGSGNRLQVATGATFIDLVMNGNYAPTAVADSATGPEDTPLAISVLANDSDTDGDTLTIVSATAATNGSAACGASSCTYTPNPNFVGTDSFTYTVSDGYVTSTATVTVTVTGVNDAPVAIGETYTMAEDTVANVAAAGVLLNDSDIDGNPLTASLVSGPSNGALTLNANGSFSYTPNANFNGSDAFTYAVSDGSLSANATATITVTPVNDAPVANADSASTAEETPVVVGVLANDSDPEGDSLSITGSSTPSNGTATCSGASCTYTPSSNFAGTDSFTYTVSDGSLTATGTVTVTVTATNDPPSAAADAASTAEDTPVTVAVAANDSDPDGDPLAITANSAPANGAASCAGTSCTYTPSANFNGTDSFTYTIGDGSATATATVTITVTPVNDAPTTAPDSATTTADAPVTINVLANDSDVDGDPLSVFAASSGSLGTVSCTAAGSCTYTPNGTSGTDSFTYSVADGAGGVASGTVTVTVQAPLCPTPVAAVFPASGAEVEPSGMLSWSGGAGAQSFSVYLGPAGSGCSTLLGTTTAREMPYGILPPGEYDWKVVATSSTCSVAPESACVRFTVPEPCPNEAPALLAPAAGAEVPREVRFEWTTVTDAVQYHLIIFTAGGGFDELAVLPQPAAPVPSSMSLTATVPLGTVTWRVIVDFPDSCPSISSTDRLMTVVTTCPTGTPEPISPLDSDAISGTPALFRWAPVAGTVRYELFLSINGAAFQSAGTVPGTEAAPGLAADIPAGASLSWYVEAELPEGCTPIVSRTVTLNVSCFPPVLSLQGEVTTDKPYEVRATIVSVGQAYLFEESDTEQFTRVLASKQGEIDPTGTFVFAMFEHEVAAPTPFFYRVKLAQTGCEFSDVGRIVVLPLPPPASTETETVVQFGNEEEIRQPLFIASPTPDRQTTYTYIATTDRDWMRVEPAGGSIGQAGVTVTVVTNPVGLPVGTNTGTVTLTFIELAGGKQALETTPVTGSKPVSVTLVTPVTNKGKGAPVAESLIIPAVAHATGVNTEWQTDMRLFNMDSGKQKYALNLTVSGQDGTLTGKSSELELAAGQNAALNDVVKQWYGLGSLPGESATGVLEIRPLGRTGAGKDAAAVPVTRSLASLASSRTYNKTANGTLGEYIPAIPFASFVGGTAPAGSEKSVLSLQQLAQTSAYRSNLGVVEASGQPVELEIRVFDGEGGRLLTLPLSLKAGEHRQLNQILAVNGLTNVTTARAEVEVVSGNGKITAYASVVDNITGDPLQVHAVDLAKIGARKYVMPGIAHFDTGKARWRTDVQMFNAGLASVTATVSFFPSGATSAAKTATVEIGPGKMKTLGDIVPTVFGETNTGGAIQIATATNSELVVTGRTYDQREAGSYGQFMSAVTEEDAIGVGDRAMQVLQMEQSSNIRSNLGVVEVTGKPVRVEITAFPAESRVTPRLEFNLQPNEFRQLNEVLKTLNAGTTYNARVGVRVIGGDGKIVAYGSAVDNLTQDPTFIPGQ